MNTFLSKPCFWFHLIDPVSMYKSLFEKWRLC